MHTVHSFHHIHTVCTFIHRHSPRFLSRAGKTSQGCLAENRTRACLTASLPTELCWNLTELRPILTEIRRTLDCNFLQKRQGGHSCYTIVTFFMIPGCVLYCVVRINLWEHKVPTYKEYNSVCPSSELGLPPTPPPAG